MWEVRITKAPIPYLYREGYFPRRFHYRVDAKKCLKEIEDKGVGELL